MPTTTNLGLTYVTPFDPAYVDLWGSPLNTIIIAFDAEFAVKTINQSFADKILSRATLKDYGETVQTVSSSSNAMTIDCTNGNHINTTLTENTTLTLSNPPPASNRGFVVWKITQDGTGSRTVTWPAAVKWTSGTPPTLTTTAAGVDIFTLMWDAPAALWYGGVFGQAFA